MTPAKPTLSACLIVKNEAKNLPRCLASLRGLAQEIIVVDTGSTDDTIAVAEAFGARVGHFEWCDDFSAARNASLELATGDWILVIDADEVLAVDAPAAWDELLRSQEYGAFLTPLHNVSEAGQAEFSTDVMRIFRRLPGVRFAGRLHESVWDSLAEAGVKAARTSQAHFLHHGYQEDSLRERDKGLRNLLIARREVEEQPDAPKSWLNLARSLTLRGAHDEAAAAYARLARLPWGLDALAPADYVGFVMGYRDTLAALNRWSDAEALLAQALERLPDEVIFSFERGRARVILGDLDGAIDDMGACLAANLDTPRIWGNVALMGELPRAVLRQVAARFPESKPRLEGWLLRTVPAPDEALSGDAWRRLEENPRDAGALFTLGRRFFESGELDKALLATSQSIHMEANRAEAYHLLGLILDGLGQASLAERAFVGSLLLDPDHPTARECRVASRSRANPSAVDAGLKMELEALLRRLSPTVSACLVVRDAAESLPRTLASLQGLVDEVVLIDAGSTDATVALAEALGARVERCAPGAPLSAARNLALGHATCDWLLMLEAGEILEIEDAQAWRMALRDRQAGAYGILVSEGLPEEHRACPMLRLCVRQAGVRFDGTSSASLLDSLLALGLSAGALSGASLHQGDARILLRERQTKGASTLRRLAERVEREPRDPEAWYRLARAGQVGGDEELAAHALAQVEQMLASGAPMGEAALCDYTLLHHRRLKREGNEAGALALLERGLERVAGYPAFLYERALARLERGEAAGARADLEACLAERGRFFLGGGRGEDLGALAGRSLETLLR